MKSFTLVIVALTVSLASAESAQALKTSLLSRRSSLRTNWLGKRSTRYPTKYPTKYPTNPSQQSEQKQLSKMAADIAVIKRDVRAIKASISSAPTSFPTTPYPAWIQQGRSGCCSLVFDRKGISAAKATDLGNALQYFPSITRVSIIRDNQFNNLAITALAPHLKQLTNLVELDFQFTSIGAAGATRLAQEFGHLPKLERLILNYNTIQDSGAVAISSKFNLIPNLKDLQINANKIGDTGGMSIANNLHKVPNLSGMAVSGNCFSPNTQGALRSKGPNIEYYNLDTQSCSN